MTPKQLTALSGIVAAGCYALTAASPFWPLVVALAALSGFNLGTATKEAKEK